MTLLASLTLLCCMALLAAWMYGDGRDGSDIRRLPGPLDANLRFADGDTIIATGILGAAVDLGENFAPDPVHPVRLGLNVTALDQANQDETYTLALEESADGLTYVPTGLSVSVQSAGTYHLVGGLTQRYARIYGTLAGTTPSITASAWLNPV